MYQGEDITLYFVILDADGNPYDIHATTAVTWVAVPSGTTTPTITKHLANMIIAVDPLGSSVVKNCMLVPLTATDTGLNIDVGQFRHELRVMLGTSHRVIYPLVGTTATFSIVPSLSWNPSAIPPAPRIVKIEASVPETDAPPTSPSYNFAHDNKPKKSERGN
jgi:hypothetical protein